MPPVSRCFVSPLTLRQLCLATNNLFSSAYDPKHATVFQAFVRVSARIAFRVLLAIPSKHHCTDLCWADPAVVQLDHAVGPTDGIRSMRNNYGGYVLQVLTETIE